MTKELVCVGQYATTELAHIARLSLEIEGVASYLDNEWVASTNWLMTDAVGGVKLLVSSLDAEAAKEILNQTDHFFRETTEEGTESHGEDHVSEVDVSAESNINEREENSLRAFRGAIMGVLFLPLHLYVLYLLLFKVFGGDVPMRRKFKQRAVLAALINIPCVFVILWFLQSIVELLLLI